MHLRRQPRRKGRIEIVPMIDVVFFLLVVFMMASLAMTTARGMPVRLPAAATGERERSGPVAVTVTRAGGLYLDREPVTLDSLPARLRQALLSDPGRAVLVDADREVLHGRVVAVIDAARRAGAARLAIAVEADDPGGRVP